MLRRSAAKRSREQRLWRSGYLGCELLPDEDEPLELSLGLDELPLLSWLLLEPELLPLGELEPPVEELEPRPKNERTLWRQLGWLKSVLASKLGADWSFEVSPANVNDCWPEEELEELDAVDDVPLLLSLPLAGRNKLQGTATCLPAPLELLEDELEAELGEVELELELGEVELELEPGELELELEPPLNERIAKSMRPEVGFTMQSLIVPRLSPELPWTVLPVSWLARIS